MGYCICAGVWAIVVFSPKLSARTTFLAPCTKNTCSVQTCPDQFVWAEPSRHISTIHSHNFLDVHTICWPSPNCHCCIHNKLSWQSSELSTGYGTMLHHLTIVISRASLFMSTQLQQIHLLATINTVMWNFQCQFASLFLWMDNGWKCVLGIMAVPQNLINNQHVVEYNTRAMMECPNQLGVRWQSKSSPTPKTQNNQQLAWEGVVNKQKIQHTWQQISISMPTMIQQKQLPDKNKW